MAENNQNRVYYLPPANQDSGEECAKSCCRFFCSLLKVGLVLLVFWLIFRPKIVKFYVSEASLTQFNLSSNNTLYYNLALNMTVRNSNKKFGIYYDAIEAKAFYEGQRFDADTLKPFYPRHKSTSSLNLVFVGQQLVLLGTRELSHFNAEKIAGVYTIDVKLYLKLRFKLGKAKFCGLNPKIKCGLKVPLSSTGNSTVVFQRTKCQLRVPKPNGLFI